MANPDKRQHNLRTAMEVLANKSICGLPILEPFQQGRKAIRLIVQQKHNLLNHHQGRSTRFSKYSRLSYLVLKQSRHVRLGLIVLDGICSSTRMYLSRI
jgi:hypothetical protein